MIYLVHADGALPNLALMRLATHLRTSGEDVRLLRQPEHYAPLLDPRPDRVYGSSIFAFSAERRARFERALGPITWGGTGVRVESALTELADIDWDAVFPDYSLYPDFAPSLGFLTRGCRLRCGFCVVPRKEGRPRIATTIERLYRGAEHPKHLHLLDNDAFAPELREHWREAVRVMREGDFRVCFSQGVNLRLIDDESAAMLASLRLTGGDFDRRRLYTAWDNLGDEGIFRRGVERLRAAGIDPLYLTVYMLVGYDRRETWESILYRFGQLVALGCEPYPMVFDRSARPDLCAFQRWAVRHLYRTVPFPDYATHGDDRVPPEVQETVREAWTAVLAKVAPSRPMRALEVLS